jgi:hypothetical protein
MKDVIAFGLKRGKQHGILITWTGPATLNITTVLRIHKTALLLKQSHM